MKQIKPNIYYFYSGGELLIGIDAYTMDAAIYEFKKYPELGEYDHITWYNGTFGGYHETNGDIALNSVN